MSNLSYTNRVETALSEWRLRESKVTQLFGLDPDKTKSIITARLEHYEQILGKFRLSKDIDEKLVLRQLNYEREKLINILYPNIFIRYFQLVVRSVAIKKIKVRQDFLKQQFNKESLKTALEKANFRNVWNTVELRIEQGHSQFTVPVSYYLNAEERLEHDLSFVKNNEGNYVFDGFKSILYSESNPAELKEHYFKIDQSRSFNTDEAYNLLAGRAVEKNGTWLQFNLCDKDAAGNYRMKEFHTEYGYDIAKVLETLPLKEMNSPDNANKLITDLKKGCLTTVSIQKDGQDAKYDIEANPQLKSINIYEQNSHKTSLIQVLKNNSTVIEQVKKENQIIKPEIRRQQKIKAK